MVTGENVGQIAIQAIRKGATDYVVKLGDYLFTIPLVVEKNLTMAKVKRENEQPARAGRKSDDRIAIQERPAAGIFDARRADGRH